MVPRISFALFGLVWLGSCGGADHLRKPELEQSSTAPRAPAKTLSKGETVEEDWAELESEPAEYD